MRIFLYKVIIEKDTFDLSQRIEMIKNLEVKDRNKTIANDYIRLEDFEKIDNLYLCDFVRIRMDHGPAKAGLETETEGFELLNDEGFGEETAFLYDPESGYLVSQYNHFGPRLQAIAEYLGLFVHSSPVNISFAPKLDGDIHAKVIKSKYVKKFSVSLAAHLLSDSDYDTMGGFGTACKKLKDTQDADNIEITISAKRSKDSSLSVSLKAAQKWITKLGGNTEGSAVKTARATASESSGYKTEVLDLLEHRITIDEDIVPGTDKRYPREKRWNALRRAHSAWSELMT